MAEGAVATYLHDVRTLRQHSESTPELSLREPLLALIRAYGAGLGRPKIVVAPEASAGVVGQPDVFVKDGPRLIGFVEAKAPGEDLLKLLRTTTQMRRYLESLPNWVLTDHYEFVFVRNGEIEGPFDLREDEAAVADGFAKFFDNVPRNIRSASRLAIEMARRARMLRDGLHGSLSVEGHGGPLRVTFDFYRKNLMDDLTDTDFADTFAQTAVYGMFLGWLRWAEETPAKRKKGDGQPAEFTRALAVDEIPASVPFLRASMRLLTDPEVLPDPVARLLDDLAALFDNTDPGPIRAETAAVGIGPDEDLAIYFYEKFLAKYDAGERKKRGVYYTPPELVGYIVNAVQETLVKEFSREKGLADAAVVLLDPAVGTGTFVLGAAQKAIQVVAAEGTAAQRKLVREHLLHDYYGFELLPAAYAVAHLKVGSFFDQNGYKLTERDRAQIYLTNTLHGEDEIVGQLEFLPILGGITEEAVAAGRVKRDVSVLVVLGNPPYERTSHNTNPFADQLQEDFYKIDGQRLPDRNSAPLKDDYLRFIRWATWKLLEQEHAPGHGILAFVTNRAFIERTLHRGVRKFLLDHYDEIHVFDLHGDQREWFRDRVDEKVFKQVQAGIAVTIMIRRRGPRTEQATVRYRERFGTRGDKLGAIKEAALADAEWETLAPKAPLWLMVPYNTPECYDTWPTVADLFPHNVIGVQTHRDQLVVADTEEELRERLSRFADEKVPDREWINIGVKDSAEAKGWKLSKTRSALRGEGPRNVREWTYRGLERRWVAFDDRLIDRTRTQISPHLLDVPGNIALAFSNGSLPDGPYAVVARGPVPAAVLSWRTFGAAYMAPLWLLGGQADSRVPNLPGDLISRLAKVGISARPESFLHYVYAILNSPAYRTSYADGLRYGFARVPVTRDRTTFDSLAALGRDLVAIHLLDHPDLAKQTLQMDGNDQAELTAPTHDEERVCLAPTLMAHPITAAEWAYQQGSYPVLRDYLDQRQGRPLTSREFDTFRRLAAAVRMTLDILPRIDALIPAAAESALTYKEMGLTSTVTEE